MCNNKDTNNSFHLTANMATPRDTIQRLNKLTLSDEEFVEIHHIED